MAQHTTAYTYTKTHTHTYTHYTHTCTCTAEHIQTSTLNAAVAETDIKFTLQNWLAAFGVSVEFFS